MSEGNAPSIIAKEILKRTREKFEKTVKVGDILLYRNAVDKAFLSMMLTVNPYYCKLNVMPRSHNEGTRA
ncbi:MAG: hypothetical protein QW294_03625 [Candidatus Bathyarchaeia archaeon]